MDTIFLTVFAAIGVGVLLYYVVPTVWSLIQLLEVLVRLLLCIPKALWDVVTGKDMEDQLLEDAKEEEEEQRKQQLPKHLWAKYSAGLKATSDWLLYDQGCALGAFTVMDSLIRADAECQKYFDPNDVIRLNVEGKHMWECWGYRNEFGEYVAIDGWEQIPTQP